MVKRRKCLYAVFAIVILSVILWFLFPRSFVQTTSEVRSIAIQVVDESFEHENKTYVYNDDAPEFNAIFEVLNKYSYHWTLQTIPCLSPNSTHIEGNKAGYWLNISFYSETDRYGECIDLTSGGTGEIIFNSTVYRIGYLGNKAALQMMDDVVKIIEQEN